MNSHLHNEHVTQMPSLSFTFARLFVKLNAFALEMRLGMRSLYYIKYVYAFDQIIGKKIVKFQVSVLNPISDECVGTLKRFYLIKFE